jgi:ABC-type transport system involved in multi-copper enzyme maturation permease subunit
MSDAQPAVERVRGYADRTEAWRDRIGIFLWLVGTLLILTFAGQLSVPVLLLLGAAWILTLGLLARKSWFLFFGPVFFYDVIRLGRRKWIFWVRVLMTGFLGSILLLMYDNWFGRNGTGQYFDSISRYARFSELFFGVFCMIQLIIISLLTPSYLAPSISEEKEKRTLEFLFATDLRNREILFGKLAARIGMLTLFLLAGVPILTLTQFFGGVDPNQVIVYSLGTFVWMLFLAAVAIWCSVGIKKSRDAIALASLIPIAYLVLSGVGYGLARMAMDRGQDWMLESIKLFNHDICFADLLLGFSRGNMIVILGDLEESTRRGAIYTDELWRLSGRFTLFHGFWIVLLLTVSVWRLRTLGLRQSASEVRTKVKRGRIHPQVTDSPMVWKEVYVESTFRAGWAGKALVILIAGLTFVPAFIITYYYFFEPTYWSNLGGTSKGELFSREMNEYVRVVSTVVACLLFLGSALRGAGSVRGEKDKQTFDSLMTSPLTVKQILWGKWWGCVVGNRFGLYWLAGIWTIGLCTGGLHPMSIPLLVIAFFIFSSAFAWFGIWCSLTCSTTLRATVWGFMSSIFFGGGYLILMALCCVATAAGRGAEAPMKMLVGLCPGVTMSYLPFRNFSEDEVRFIGESSDVWAMYAFIGLAVWCGATALISFFAAQRFAHDNNRRWSDEY